MVQADDGTLIPWVSDGGKPMRIAAAQPDIPWTDLAYSLQPNGHTLDYVADAPYLQRGRIGVMKQSFVSGLYATGQATSNYAPPGTDPDADLITWFASINAGEPYDTNPLSQDIVDEITTHHSSYYIDDSTSPAPLLISNGWTDDLFPADEAIRFYNRTRSHAPRHAGLADLHRPRPPARPEQGPGRDVPQPARRTPGSTTTSRATGPAPFQGVQTLTQACGGPSGGATGQFDDPDTDQPFRAPTWAQLAPGEVRFADAGSKLIASAVSDQAGSAFDPIAGGGACATAPAADQTGTASYRLDPAPDRRLHADGLADDHRRHQLAQPDVAARGPAAGRRRRAASTRRSSRAGSTGRRSTRARDSTRQVFQLHAERLEVRGRPHREARAAAGGPALRAQLQRPGADHGLQPRAAPAGARGSRARRAEWRSLRRRSCRAATSSRVDYTGAYARPAGASPLRVPLVPAYQQCTAADMTHGPPLAFPSCSSPDQASPNLTVGTPDANGRGANSIGFVRLATIAGTPSTPEDEADVNVEVSISDVRETAGLGDYTGELNQVTTLRITDRANGTGNESGTVQDTPLAVTVPCTATPETDAGLDLLDLDQHGRAHAGLGAGGQALDLGARAGSALRRRPRRCGRDGRQLAVRGSGRVRAVVVVRNHVVPCHGLGGGRAGPQWRARKPE